MFVRYLPNVFDGLDSVFGKFRFDFLKLVSFFSSFFSLEHFVTEGFDNDFEQYML